MRIVVGISFSPVSYFEYPVCDIPSIFAIWVWFISLSSLKSLILLYFIKTPLRHYYILDYKIICFRVLTFNLNQVIIDLIVINSAVLYIVLTIHEGIKKIEEIVIRIFLHLFCCRFLFFLNIKNYLIFPYFIDTYQILRYNIYEKIYFYMQIPRHIY